MVSFLLHTDSFYMITTNTLVIIYHFDVILSHRKEMDFLLLLIPSHPDSNDTSDDATIAFILSFFLCPILIRPDVNPNNN
mmetsp:Transcript_11296/g.12405  ORF Transcript_11296/g.12405 Transcript_11296/m.12405 type:complete len:80 (+) Transcript_11296:241-480(+)